MKGPWNFTYNFERLIIGNSLSALLFSFQHNIPYISCRNAYPSLNKFFEPSQEFNPIYSFANETTEYQTNEGIKKLGAPWHQLWGDLGYITSMASLNLGGGDIFSSIRWDHKQQSIKATTRHNRTARYNADAFYVFDDTDIFGIPPVEQPCTEFEVLDMLKMQYIKSNDIDMLLDKNSDFCQTVHKEPYCEAYAFSYLSKYRLKKFEYSESAARFKVAQMLTDAGVPPETNTLIAVENGVEKRKKRNIACKHIIRHVFPVEMGRRANDGKLRFMYQTPIEFLKEPIKYNDLHYFKDGLVIGEKRIKISGEKKSYKLLSYLWHYLGGRSQFRL